MRRSSVLILVAFAGAGALLALVPFGKPGPRGSYTYSSGSTPSSTCGSPVVAAWRHEPAHYARFGYVPLTGTQTVDVGPGLHAFRTTTVSLPPCTETARRRLAMGALLMVPGALVWLLRRRR